MLRRAKAARRWQVFKPPATERSYRKIPLMTSKCGGALRLPWVADGAANKNSPGLNRLNP